MKNIAFLSDFGVKDGYVAQMKGVAASLTDAKLIDISHDVSPQNIRQGAFILQTTCPFFPLGTIFVAVVDPGVGTKRKGIVITTKKHVFIGPDNGLLLPAAHSLGDFNVYEITNEKLMNKTVSPTFHGRDIFTPVAAHILNGVAFADIGPRITDYTDMKFDQAQIHEGNIRGKVIYIDHFGNIITNISSKCIEHLVNDGKILHVSVRGTMHDIVYTKSYGFVTKGALLATLGSHQYLEFGVNQGSAAGLFSLKEDDEFQVSLD